MRDKSLCLNEEREVGGIYVHACLKTALSPHLATEEKGKRRLGDYGLAASHHCESTRGELREVSNVILS